uniref:Uncharacterized protein n=1 Tax=Helianthus annuus TaxID=4232 RepID=A0A251VDS7_HELAN
MVKPESRGTLIKFMQLMVSHHLSRRLEDVLSSQLAVRMIPEASVVVYGFCYIQSR